MTNLTIAIPTYNIRKYISELISSILVQKISYKIEVIIIDDGSTDGTIDTIKNEIEGIDYFTFIQQNHEGVGAARNKALKIATGEYILFVDGDDILAENAIQNILDKLYKDNLDLLLFSGKTFLDDGSEGTDFYPNYSRSDLGIYDGKQTLGKLVSKGEFFAMPCLYVFKLKNVERYSLEFPENVIYEDFYFSYYILLICQRCEVVKNVYYLRRIRNGSIMTSKNKSDFEFLSISTVLTQLIKDRHNFGKNNKRTEFIIFYRLYLQFLKKYNSLNDNSKNIHESTYLSTKSYYKIHYNRLFSSVYYKVNLLTIIAVKRWKRVITWVRY